MAFAAVIWLLILNSWEVASSNNVRNEAILSGLQLKPSAEGGLFTHTIHTAAGNLNLSRMELGFIEFLQPNKLAAFSFLPASALGPLTAKSFGHFH